MPTAITITAMQLDGGAACLDFINSGYNTELDVVVERLHTYLDLLLLAERLALYDEATLNALKRLEEEHAEEAQQVLLTAREARQVLYSVFMALAHGQLAALDESTLTAFNSFISSALSSRVFAVQEEQLQLAWKETSPPLAQPLQVFLLSAYELLRDKEQRYIKQCGACAWLFMDKTKNHRRKWCDMQTCGGSEKSKRYYQRKKQKQKQ